MKKDQNMKEKANFEAMELYESISSYERNEDISVTKTETPSIHMNWALLKDLALSTSPFDRMEAFVRRMSAGVRAGILAVLVTIAPILTMAMTIWTFRHFASDTPSVMKIFALAALIATVGVVYVLLHVVFLLIFRPAQKNEALEKRSGSSQYVPLVGQSGSLFVRYKIAFTTSALFLVLLAMGYFGSFRFISKGIGIPARGTTTIQLGKQDPLEARLVSKSLADEVSNENERAQLIRSYLWLIGPSEQWTDKDLIAKAPDSKILNALAVSLEAEGNYSKANNLYILGSKKNPKDQVIPLNYGKFVAMQTFRIEEASSTE